VKDQVLQFRQTQFSKTLTQMVFPITKNQSLAIRHPKSESRRKKKIKEAGTLGKKEKKELKVVQTPVPALL
jgi:hypothetical protein